MDAQRLTSEGASRPLSVPAGSCLDDAGVCFLPGFRFWRGARAAGGLIGGTRQAAVYLPLPLALAYPQVTCMSILSKLTMTSPAAFVLRWDVSWATKCEPSLAVRLKVLVEC